MSLILILPAARCLTLLPLSSSSHSFEFVVIIGVVVAALVGSLKAQKQSFLGLFIIGTLLYIHACNYFLTMEVRAGLSLLGQSHSPGSWPASYVLSASQPL